MQGMFEITDEVAVVTGAAQGNGRAIAFGLARAGAKVACCDVQFERVQEVSELIRQAGGIAHPLHLDISDEASCDAAAQEVQGALGVTSILVNNAGILRPTPADSSTFGQDWDAVMSINVGGTVKMVRSFLPQLLESRGRIINMASILAVAAAPSLSASLSAYATSKAAIVQLTRALANEFADQGVRINAIAPGVIETAMTAATRSNPEALARFMAHTPLKRPGQPEELVGAVIFLASEASSYITGALIPIDGGYLAV
jgi:NAD(P)-dependent dehydrogenase (short-subunit alcohol dehydrogenase family)